MANSKNPTSSTCLCTILHHLICSNNLASPLHPLINPQNHHNSNHHRDHDHKSAIVAPYSQAQTTQEPRKTPGVVARLMGLDSLPNHHSQNFDSINRSKSLNSLRCLPDFEPARISLHRTGKGSASFHECETGHKFLAKIDENSEINRRKTKECEVGSRDLKRVGKQRREKVVMLKEADRIRGNKEKGDVMRGEKRRGGKYERGKINHFRKSKIKNNVELGHSGASSRSPVSVHHHHHRHLGFDSPSKGDSKLVVSNPGRGSSPKKFKVFDDKLPQYNIKLKFEKNKQCSNWSNSSWKYNNSMKAEMAKAEMAKAKMAVADYFVLDFGQVCKLVEEEIRDPKKWTRKYQILKVGFMQELGKDFGLEILDFLLDELMHDIIVN